MIYVNAWMDKKGDYSGHKGKFYDWQYEEARQDWDGLDSKWDRARMLFENDDGEKLVLDWRDPPYRTDWSG